MSDRKFSPAVVAATAGITFLISGFGGAALSEWLARPIPLVTVSSVGFSGSETHVDTDANLITITKESPWIRSYRKFESFSSMENDHLEVSKLKKRLEIGIAIVNDWIKSNSDNMSIPDRILTIEELNNSPYMADVIVGSTLIGMARRGELNGAPNAIGEVTKHPPVTEITSDGSKWILYFYNRNVVFPFGQAITETEKSAIKLLAFSFAHGNGSNIVYYLKRFQAGANENFRNLIEITEELEKAMLPSTKLSITASIFNSGRKPLVLKPYALLTVLNEEIDSRNHIVKAELATTSDALRWVTEEKEDAGSEDVLATSFLPPTSGGSYILVAPNSKADVKLTSIEKLGAAGAQLRSIYNSNVLRCQVTMHDISGTKLVSEALLFGPSMDKDLKKELLSTP